MKRYVAFQYAKKYDKIRVADLYTLTIQSKYVYEVREDISNGIEYDNVKIENKELRIKDNFPVMQIGIVIARYESYLLVCDSGKINLTEIPTEMSNKLDKTYDISNNFGINHNIDSYNLKMKMLGDLNTIAFPINEEFAILFKRNLIDANKEIVIPKFIKGLSIQAIVDTDEVDNVKHLKIKGIENIKTLNINAIQEIMTVPPITEFNNLEAITSYTQCPYKELRLKGIKLIGAGAFRNSAIKYLYIEDGPIKIGKAAFQNCAKLEKIRLPIGLENIPMNCFDDCEKLKEVEIPNTCKRILDKAFRGCESLERLVIPEGVTELRGYRIFEGCNKLEFLQFPRSLRYVDNINYIATKIKTLRIPKDLNRRYLFEVNMYCKIEYY